MDPEVAGALIGAAGGVVAAILAVTVTRAATRQ
jgi:hypothetical protein